jgi:hypothetical protein
MSPEQEAEFQDWYKGWAAHTGINPNPDDPKHFYDYRGAYQAGVSPSIDPTDGLYHWDSRFKTEEHPNKIVNGVNTITGQKVGGNPMADELSNVLAQLGNFATSPQMPVLAGQLGAAAMGPNQNSWQANVGKVASGYGQSAIAANEAKAQGEKAAQTNAFMKQLLPYLLAGNKMTPAEELGPSGQTIKINPDGTAKITTDVTAQVQGNNAPAGAPQIAAPGQPQAPVQAPQRPVQAPGVNPRLLPF